MEQHILSLPEAVQATVSQVMELGSRVEPFSSESRNKVSRIRDAKVVKSVCPYCAVGCGLNVYVKDGKVIDIEGNPDSPINHGTLCPKGSATFQYTVNPSRLTQVLYRAPYSDHWEVKSLDWAMEQIAQRVKMTRDETFVERLPDGREVNHTLGIASLGGATLDVEENYLTNAAMLIRKDYQDTEDLNGLFSGYDPETGTYADQSSWEYQYDEQGRPLTDPTLQHPQCVFQIMRRHFARYTPEMVEHVCGVSQEQFQLVVQTIIENSGRERTTALCYAVGWTQQSKGVQIIRAGAIIQLLLGNIGRPGGGIMALRGHASIQGSTDVPTLYDLLAGYMPQPSALLSPVPEAEHSPGATTWGEKRDVSSNVLSQQTLQEYIDSAGQKLGWWSNTPAYIRSLVQAWYGDAANEEEGNTSYRWLPKIIGDHSHLVTSYAMLDGKVKGYFLFGQNPAAGSTHATMQRKALEQLDWMVVRDLYEVESAAFWYRKPGFGPETEPVDSSKIKTEIFLLPAAASTEKEGSFTNTQRMLQWR